MRVVGNYVPCTQYLRNHVLGVLTLPNYELFTANRVNRVGGGVALLWKPNLAPTQSMAS